jgi:hypothetical protein
MAAIAAVRPRGRRRILNEKAEPKSEGRYLLDSALRLLIGAGEMNRTPDLLITNELLYRLSYTG